MDGELPRYSGFPEAGYLKQTPALPQKEDALLGILDEGGVPEGPALEAPARFTLQEEP